MSESNYIPGPWESTRQLIAAAPELLEALESLVETTERAKEKSIAFYGGSFYPCLKQAQAAIKKAKGLK